MHDKNKYIDFRFPPSWRAPAPQTLPGWGAAALKPHAQGGFGSGSPTRGVWGTGAPKHKGKRKSILNAGHSKMLRYQLFGVNCWELKLNHVVSN